MATVKLSDIENLVEKSQNPKAQRLALEFLELFEADRMLDQEEFDEWIKISSLSGEEVKAAANEAVRRGWVKDTPDGLLLTATGRHEKEN